MRNLKLPLFLHWSAMLLLFSLAQRLCGRTPEESFKSMFHMVGMPGFPHNRVSMYLNYPNHKLPSGSFFIPNSFRVARSHMIQPAVQTVPSLRRHSIYIYILQKLECLKWGYWGTGYLQPKESVRHHVSHENYCMINPHVFLTKPHFLLLKYAKHIHSNYMWGIFVLHPHYDRMTLKLQDPTARNQSLTPRPVVVDQ